MSRTYRNIEHAKYFTHPKTLNHKKKLYATYEEIKEELGNSYLQGNNRSYKLLPSAWDDKYISAREEVLERSYYIERIFENRLISLFGEVPNYLVVNFNTYKNRIEITKTYRRRARPSVIYLPTCLKYKHFVYPVELYPHNWDE
jgi:hypothetical protein